MKTINLKLVHSAYPSIALEELVQLDELLLAQTGIEEIDGLELFDKLARLDCSNNKIKIIENLEFLPALKYLDLSNNLINNIYIDAIPNSLEFINISGKAPSFNEIHERLLVRWKEFEQPLAPVQCQEKIALPTWQKNRPRKIPVLIS